MLVCYPAEEVASISYVSAFVCIIEVNEVKLADVVLVFDEARLCDFLFIDDFNHPDLEQLALIVLQDHVLGNLGVGYRRVDR